MIDGNEDNVLGKQVQLKQTLRQQGTLAERGEESTERTFLVHFASLPFSYPSFSSLLQKKVLK